MRVIGFGTGRCGTQSLARLLDKQPGFSCTHEMSPELPYPVNVTYPKDDEMAKERVRYFEENDNVGDVALYNMYYLRWFQDIPDVRFVWLERPREEVVESFMKRTPTRNHWQWHNGDFWELDDWDKRFPNFGIFDINSDPYEQKRQAIGAYWDWYREQALMWSNKLPVFYMRMEYLNDEDKVNQMLDFIGIPEQDRIIKAIQSNAIQEWD